MDLSPLQKARYAYNPKLPGMLRGGIAEISVKTGAPTESVADQDSIKALFPNTYGKNEVTFVKGSNTSAPKKQVVGVILSGGQAPEGIMSSAVFMTRSRQRIKTTSCSASRAALQD